MAKKNELEITVKIEGQEWKDALEKAYQTASKKAKIDGFRQGKAPKEMFMKKYGEQSLYMDAGDLVIEKAYLNVMKEHKDLELVAQPEISLKEVDGEKIEFIFTLILRPEVKLGNYKDLKIKKEAVKVTNEEIEKTIEQMRNKYSENIVKEGNIVEGDIAVIDFEGFDKDGVPFEGGKGENYSLTIGSHTFITGFEEQLIGMTVGDEKEINVTFPEDYHAENLKGQPVVFKVSVNEIKEIFVPEINEDFFEDLNMEGVTTIEELKKQVEETIKARKETDTENKYIDDLLEEVSKNTEVEVPENMIHDEAHRMVHQYEENLQMQGITLEQFFQYTNSNEEALIDQMHDEAKKRVISRLVLEEIVKTEKIEISEEDAKKEAAEIAKKYQMETEEFLKEFGGIEMVKYDLTMRKAVEVIKGNK
ncbi:MAG: trigger factor [Bacilli bacterium]